MEIKTIGISHFGKYHHKTINFSSGLNLIEGQTESDTSTIHAFIIAMLFGLDKKKGREPNEDRYQMYLPSETPTLYGGWMDIALDGKTYRITRNFYNATKENRILNLETGQETELYRGEHSSVLEGSNRVNFENAISIEQGKAENDSSLIREVQRYYANLVTAKSGMIDLINTQNRLREELKAIPQEETRRRIEETYKQLQQVEKVKEEKKELDEKLEQEIESQEITSSLQTYDREIIRVTDEKDAMKETIYQYRLVTRQIKEYKEVIARRDEEKRKKEAIAHSLYVNASMYALIVIGCVFGAMIQNWIIFFTTLGMVLGIFITREIYVHLAEEKCKESEEEEGYRISLFEKERRLLEELLENQTSLSFKNLSMEAAFDVVMKQMDEKLVTLVKERKQCELDYENRKLALQVESSKIEEKVTIYESLKEKYDQQLEQLKLQEEQSRAIELSIRMIERLSGAIKESFGVQINRDLSRMVYHLTNKYSEVYVDEKGNLFVGTEGEKVPIYALHSGIIHQINFALHMVYAKYLVPYTNLPLILEGGFVNYDNNVRLKEVLQSLPRDQQLLLFTSQNGEKQRLEEISIPFYYIHIIE